jgi:hypothetical protein
MNSIKKCIVNFSLCLITVLALVSCSSSTSRDVASDSDARVEQKDDISKIEDGAYPPSKFHSHRNEYYNSQY